MRTTMLMTALSLLSTVAGCAVATAPDRGDSPRLVEPGGESDHAAVHDEIIRVPIGVGPSLQLQATLNEAQTIGGTAPFRKAYEQFYLGVRVTNAGNGAAAATEIVVTCPPRFNGAPMQQASCVHEPMVLGVPALAAGAFFDLSFPTRGIELGTYEFEEGGPRAQFAQDVDVALVYAPTDATPIASASFVNGCDEYFVDCTQQVPAAPATAPGSTALVGTPLAAGLDYYSWSIPVQVSQSIYAPTTDEYLGSVPVYGGQTAYVTADVATPNGLWWTSYSGETVQILLDGAVVGTYVTGSANSTPITLPPYDANTHTIQTRFQGSGELTPTLSEVTSFTLTPILRIPVGLL
jgi:hypothetical protein